jgi:hypothetical protein
MWLVTCDRGLPKQRLRSKPGGRGTQVRSGRHWQVYLNLILGRSHGLGPEGQQPPTEEKNVREPKTKCPNGLENVRAMVMTLESFGVDGVQRSQCDRDRAAKFDKPAVKILFQVTQIARFLLERGLRFRNLGFCGHDLM